MRPHVPVIAFVLAATVLGCAPDFDRALRIDAFDAEGRTTTDLAALASRDAELVVFAFEEGDEIDVVSRIEAAGYAERIDDTRLRILKPFELSVTSRGVWVREPGGDFERIGGQVAVSFAMSESRRRNEVVVSVGVDGAD